MFNTLPANPFPPSSEQMGAGGGGSYELPVASAETLGGVKVGNNLSIADGVLSAPAPYSLPTASAETLGGVKVGSNLSIADGVLSAPAPYSLPTASAETLGGVKVGSGLSIDDGVLSTSGGYSVTTIYTGDGTSQSTYALTQPVNSFDFIGVRFLRTNNLEIFNIYPSSYLMSLITTGNSTGVATNDKWCFFGLTDASTLVRRDESDLHVIEVFGINV